MKELVSTYKSNVFMHRHSSNQLDLSGLTSLKKTSKLIRQLSEDAIKDEPELIYLIKSMKLISERDMADSHRHALMNAVTSQLCEYVVGGLEMIGICFLAFHLFTNSLGLVVGDLFFLFSIESFNANLQTQLRKIKPFYLTPNLINHVVKLSIDPANLSVIPKKVVSNTYEFAKSSLRFFYHKIIDSTPVQYELPADIQESISRLEGAV